MRENPTQKTAKNPAEKAAQKADQTVSLLSKLFACERSFKPDIADIHCEVQALLFA